MDGTIMPLILGMGVPTYTPPPTPENPTPQPTVDFNKWQAVSDKYFSEYHDNGNFFTALDDSINDTIPGGWATVAAVSVAVATGYVDPTLFATEAGTTALATEGATTLTAAEMATLSEASALADTAMAGAGGVGAGAGTVGATAFTGATETGLGTLAGEGATTDLAGTTLLGDAGATGATESAVGEAFTSPIAETPISQYELSPITDFSPEVPIESVSPEFDPTGSLQTPQPTPTYDFSPETPIEQVSPELDPTGSLADTGITAKDIAKTLRTANTIKNVVKALTPQEQALKNAQTSQQQMNMANMLRGTQMPQTMTPAIYKQANPFNFGQQNQPVQDTTALANLLRTA
jgi:hypothetical protein